MHPAGSQGKCGLRADLDTGAQVVSRGGSGSGEREVKHSACRNWGCDEHSPPHVAKYKGFIPVLPVHSNVKCACVSLRMFKWAQHLAELWQCLLSTYPLTQVLI